MITLPRKQLKKRPAPKIMLHDSGEVYHLPVDPVAQEEAAKRLKKQFGNKISDPDTYKTL